MSDPKLKRGSTVTLTFTLGNPGQLETMLLNMHRRAVVGAPGIVCEIDGARQDWWAADKPTEEEKRAAARRWIEEQDERRRKDAAIVPEIRRDPSRSDAEVAAALGVHPSRVGHLRVEALEPAERAAIKEAIKTELERHPNLRGDALCAAVGVPHWQTVIALQTEISSDKWRESERARKVKEETDGIVGWSKRTIEVPIYREGRRGRGL